MSHRPFQSEVFPPSQFLATSRGQAPSKMGEYRLLVALMDDAVERFKKYVLTGNRDFEEAHNWIMGGDDDVGSKQKGASFSFEYVCDALGFEADHLRQGLQRWSKAQIGK